MDTAVRPQLDPDGRRRGVGHERGDRCRQHAPGPLVPQGVPRLHDRQDRAHSRGHGHGQTLRGDLWSLGLLPGLAGGQQRALAGAVKTAHLAGWEHLGGIDRQGSADPHGQLMVPDPLVLKGANRAGALVQSAPGGLDVCAQRVDGPQAGDDDVVRAALGFRAHVCGQAFLEVTRSTSAPTVGRVGMRESSRATPKRSSTWVAMVSRPRESTSRSWAKVVSLYHSR